MKINKIHVFYLAILLALCIITTARHVTWNQVRYGDPLSLDYYIYPFVKNTVVNQHQFPHWFPHYMGGMPFFAHSQNTVLYFSSLIYTLLPIKVENFFILMIVLNSFLAGAFMYALMIYLKQQPKIAFLSAVIWSFSAFVQHWSHVWQYRAGAIIWLPLVLLFLLKALKEKNWLTNSVIVGILMAFSFYSSGLIPFVFTFVVFFCFAIVYAVGKKFQGRVLKLTLIFAVIGIVLLGLAAVKLLPMLEFAEISSKKYGFSYEESIGQHIEIENFSDFIRLLKAPLVPRVGLDPARIGISVVILGLLSLLLIRKRLVIFLFLIAFLALAIASGSDIYYVLWKFIPGFNKLHHVWRGMFLFGFSFAILAGLGAALLLKRLGKRYAKHLNIFYIIILAVVLTELVVFDLFSVITAHPYVDFREQMEQNELMQYISKQPGIFRINNFGTHGIGGITSAYTVPLNLEILYGTTSIWIPEYMNIYLSVANNNPAKFWGMLNTKYVYYKDELNVSGLKFVNKFEKCEICIESPLDDSGISGPYLYENELYLPRAYTAEHSVLVIGNEQQMKQTSYGVMLSENLNPASTVVVMKTGRIEDYEQSFLNRFDLIILTEGSVTQNSGGKLQAYTDSGGVIFPNVFDQGNNPDLEMIFDSFGGNYADVKEIEHVKYTPNRRILQLNGEKGFLVISEKYFMFEAWMAKVDGNAREILRANGINSAVYLEGNEKEIVFKYESRTFRNGLIITIITILVLTAYFVRKRISQLFSRPT